MSDARLFPPSTHLYGVLRLDPRNATKADVRNAYRRMALETHPDKNENTDHERFQLVNEAYTVLSDDARKQTYDRDAVAEQWQRLRQQQQRRQPNPPPHHHLNAVFSRVFRGGSDRSPDQQLGSGSFGVLPLKDTRADFEVSPRELKHGVSKTVSVRLQHRCPSCAGSGIAEVSERSRQCPVCCGGGKVIEYVSPLVGIQTACGRCAGGGRVANLPVTGKNACASCGGLGFSETSRSIHVRLPAGSIIDGKIYQIRNGPEMGDLFLRARYDDACRAYRIDHETGDVCISVPLQLSEVLTGFRKTIDVFGEIKTVHSGRGAQGFERKYTDPTLPVVLKGGGIPSAKSRGSSIGDFIVRFEVVWPSDDDKCCETAQRLKKYGDVIDKIFVPHKPHT